jgi:hypothetical protein
MDNKKKKSGLDDFLDDFAYDITLIPTNFTDMTAIPIVGGLITRNQVEIAEEMLAEDFDGNHPQNAIRNNIKRNTTDEEDLKK